MSDPLYRYTISFDRDGEHCTWSGVVSDQDTSYAKIRLTQLNQAKVISKLHFRKGELVVPKSDRASLGEFLSKLPAKPTRP